MDQDLLAIREDLEDLHRHLVDSYEQAESLVGRPGVSPEVNQALAGLQYSVAKAAQDAWRMLDNPSLWESS